MKKTGKILIAIFTLIACITLSSVITACSNSGDGATTIITKPNNTGTQSDGGQTTTTETPPSTTTSDPVPPPTTTPTSTPIPATFTITFNANDGSETPASATQSFTEGISQNLKTITELGFSKSGYNFAGWGTAPDSSKSTYADGTSYTASSDITLYALWSTIPLYNVNIIPNQNGNVIATLATATAGTEITLSNTPKNGYRFSSYTVTDIDSNQITVTNGKFIMPEGNVNVTTIFTANYYSITCGTFTNGSIVADKTRAIVDQDVTLTISPTNGYKLETLSVKATDGSVIATTENGNTRNFKMPAKNVIVSATFSATTYTITCGTFINGTVTSDKNKAAQNETVTLTITPSNGYKLSSIVVTAADNSSVSFAGSGTKRTFEMPAQNVTINAKFTTSTASGAYTEIEPITINGIEYRRVTFGLWPQTIKAENVRIHAEYVKTVGPFTYYKGWDDEWYVKADEYTDSSSDKYSDGTTVGQYGNSYKYFKVEPIKWLILTDNYNGKKLLLAENILTSCQYYSQYNDYIDETLYPNNYQNSRLRAFLNGLEYRYRRNSTTTTRNADFEGKGFLQTAFTESERNLIAQRTKVDNSERSTNPDENDKQWNEGKNPYACDNTYDAIFALSEQEATKAEYGFPVYNNYSRRDNPHTRIREMTDYAKASGADKKGCRNWYWLRSPDYAKKGEARKVASDGDANEIDRVIYEGGGVVPALCIK